MRITEELLETNNYMTGGNEDGVSKMNDRTKALLLTLTLLLIGLGLLFFSAKMAARARMAHDMILATNLWNTAYDQGYWAGVNATTRAITVTNGRAFLELTNVIK